LNSKALWLKLFPFSNTKQVDNNLASANFRKTLEKTSSLNLKPLSALSHRLPRPDKNQIKVQDLNQKKKMIYYTLIEATIPL
jgi:hypothetical protein